MKIIKGRVVFSTSSGATVCVRSMQAKHNATIAPSHIVADDRSPTPIEDEIPIAMFDATSNRDGKTLL